MTRGRLALTRAEARLLERLAQLDSRLDSGEDVWTAYTQAVAALATIAPLTAPGADRVMTTDELATAFQLTAKTARRKGLKGELPVTPIRLGGARAKIRWAAR